ncbi:unnamed protein product [Phaeothamnion confervicola]
MATLETQAELRKTAAAARKVAAGAMELGEGHVPLVLDAIDLGVEAWAAISKETVARCWLKADILPLTVQAELAVKHGKPAWTPGVDPAFQALYRLLDRRSAMTGRRWRSGRGQGSSRRSWSMRWRRCWRWDRATLLSSLGAGGSWGKVGHSGCTPRRSLR